MTIRKMFVACLLVLTLAGITAGCGDNTAASADGQQSGVQVTEEQAAVEEAVVEQAMPTPDAETGVEALLGKWEDVSSPDRFAHITKTESGYQYEDNEGKYPATFENGILKVKVSDTDAADVYIDTKTGHLLAVYQGNQSEFLKK